VITTSDASIYDLLIVGGGINGAGIARDAAGRGLRVALVEQDDLAAHTSSASTKLIHGGLRYLEHGELRLVREALTERERLLHIAPHIIRPLQFVLPYVDGLRPRWLLRLGLFVYDHAGGREQLAASSSTPLAGNILGAALRDEIKDGFTYADCWVEDSRLVVLNALDAAERGAHIHTQTRLVSAHSEQGLWYASCEAQGTNTCFELRARTIVNAAGAWVNKVLGLLNVTPRQRLRLVKGSHIVVRRHYSGEHAYLLQSADRRVIFAIPFEIDFTLIGTTDVPYSADPALPRIEDAETDYLLQCANRFFRQPLTRADVVHSYSGVRPLYDDGSAQAASQLSRDYHLELQTTTAGAKVLTVYGGKITTYRRLAETALEKIYADAQAIHDNSWTGSVALPGGDFPNGDLFAFHAHNLQRWPGLPPRLLARLARLYGTRMSQILGDAKSVADLGRDFGDGLHMAELRYLIQKEWARTAQDVLWRRTRLGLTFKASSSADSAVNDLQNAMSQLLREHELRVARDTL
jgi:glycerol-3-phosphate dehydrogenase